MTKELSGLEETRSAATPSVDDLASHFATKMSNGIGELCNGTDLPDYPVKPLKSFKIRFIVLLEH